MAVLRDRPLGILDEQVTEACCLAIHYGAEEYAIECFMHRWVVETWATDLVPNHVPAINVARRVRA